MGVLCDNWGPMKLKGKYFWADATPDNVGTPHGAGVDLTVHSTTAGEPRVLLRPEEIIPTSLRTEPVALDPRRSRRLRTGVVACAVLLAYQEGRVVLSTALGSLPWSVPKCGILVFECVNSRSILTKTSHMFREEWIRSRK